MKALEGDWYDEAAMNKRIRGLLATGAFSSARLTTEDVADGTIDATLHLQEARAKEISFAAGGGLLSGIHLPHHLHRPEPVGRAAGLQRRLRIQLARGLLGETRITDPWLFGTRCIRHRPRLCAHLFGREGYSS